MFSKKELTESRALEGKSENEALRSAYSDVLFLLDMFTDDGVSERAIQRLEKTKDDLQRALIDHDPAHAEIMEEISRRDTGRTFEHIKGKVRRPDPQP